MGALPTPTERAPDPKLPRRSVVPVSGKPLVDGYYFGFIKGVDLKRDVVRVDFALWYGCKCTDDYNIRNVAKTIWSVPLDPNAIVTIFKGPPGQYFGTLKDLAVSMRESRHQAWSGGTYRGRYGKYWLLIRAGRIVRIDDIFTP
jgi:hypothetical protein